MHDLRGYNQVLSFCEHGELSGLLKKYVANGNAFDISTKHRFCSEVAAGMAHLGAHNFIHRDLVGGRQCII
jgi:hypothetical protein